MTNDELLNVPVILDRERPIVAIVGRPNVGKSTLFNRIVGARISITDDQSGVTRDRIFSTVEWSSHRFTLVDTGGFVPLTVDDIESAVCDQIEIALNQSDGILQVVDTQVGVTDIDIQISNMVRARDIPVILVANKVDSPSADNRVAEFYSLGIGEPFSVSAANGRRSGDLLDEILSRFSVKQIPNDNEEETFKVALAGRPNVGKSTLINRLAGHSVSIVNERPGTTRDTTKIDLSWRGQQIELMDTAGLRRRSKVDTQIEYYSSRRAKESIEQADVVITLLDASEGFVHQEARIMDQIIDSGCAMIIAVNKWDIDEVRAGGGAESFRKNLIGRFPFVQDYPTLFTSGLTGRNVQKLLDAVIRVGKNRRTRISTSKLNKLLQSLVFEGYYSKTGKDLKVVYATQHAVDPPTFTIFCNSSIKITTSTKRHFEKLLRTEFDFEGSPIRILWRTRK
ncbi:MAG: ribosome biogenesis GTPase Der [Candidatus Latescibacterota bacterium]|nr:ribosome biogenesis GTPase Der [Candidatus Latescibacterota bacterium]